MFGIFFNLILLKMVKNILNLEGVAVLTKQQQKMINGGLKIRNLKATGFAQEYNGGNVACWCTWQVKENGKWVDTSGPCPTSLEYSCI